MKQALSRRVTDCLSVSPTLHMKGLSLVLLFSSELQRRRLLTKVVDVYKIMVHIAACMISIERLTISRARN